MKFCHPNCRYLAPWEENQSELHEMHICGKYNVRVLHGKFHPKLIRVGECDEFNTIYPMYKNKFIKKEKTNWWKVPFEIMAMFVMMVVWGSKATHRMISSETKYQVELDKQNKSKSIKEII